MGEKACNVRGVFTLTKGMRVVGQGKKSTPNPYSYVILHAPPKYHISLAQDFGNRTLQMVFATPIYGAFY
jgi:hypothetical protein